LGLYKFDAESQRGYMFSSNKAWPSRELSLGQS